MTYTKILNVAQHLVVEGEVITRDDVDPGILLDLPVFQAEPLGLRKEIGLRDSASPVCTPTVFVSTVLE